MDYVIRKGKLEDKEGANDAHVRSIREICAKDYTPEQIAGWSAVVYTDEHWKNTIENDFYYVVEVDGKIEGMIHARRHDNDTGEIMGLYFSPVVAGKGIGREAFNLAMDYLKEVNPKKIVIDGTKTAKGFYEKMGFVQYKEEQIYETRGVSFPYYPMELILRD